MLDQHILAFVLSFLPPIDIVSFTQTCKEYRDPFYLDLVFKNYKSQLKLYLNFNPASLQHYGITGSTFLQCFYGERWEKSDIDIFIKDFWENELFKQAVDESTEKRLSNYPNMSSIKINYGDRIIDLLKIDESAIEKVKTYDLSICSNYSTANGMYIGDFNAVMNRKTKFDKKLIIYKYSKSHLEGDDKFTRDLLKNEYKKNPENFLSFLETYFNSNLEDKEFLQRKFCYFISSDNDHFRKVKRIYKYSKRGIKTNYKIMIALYAYINLNKISLD